MKQLTILGSTGSIGCSTLDVVRHNPRTFPRSCAGGQQKISSHGRTVHGILSRYAVMDDEASAKLLKRCYSRSLH